jgi:tetrapyrrole methylase family protein/MazG family protein
MPYFPIYTDYTLAISREEHTYFMPASTVSITIVGLGSGQPSDLTVQARDVLEQAAASRQLIYFRTAIHPIVDPLRETLPALQFASFDHLYDASTNWETLYDEIARELCTRAEQQPVIYAVPGHPLVGEESVPPVLALARLRGLSTAIVAGLSFLEPVCTLLGLDPLTPGTQIMDATTLAALHVDEIAGKIIPTLPLLVVQVYNRRLASAVKLALSELYPDEWQVRQVWPDAAANGPDEPLVTMPLYELDHSSKRIDHFSTLYVPPVDALTALRRPETLRYITMRLRREPDGCPWDRQQTHQSLTHYVLEETYEVVEALEAHDMEALAEELGDLLLQVYLHAEIARQEGEFAIGDVYQHINAKLIRRHPHVFGTVEVSGAGQVIQNWEEIKRQERAAAGTDLEAESVLDRVPLASPALLVAEEYGKRTAKTGFEFAKLEDLFIKLQEELQELREAETSEHRREELGDVLFMVTEIARWLHIDAEEALRYANRKFRRRFQAMEEIARQEEQALASYTKQQWGVLWKRAKEKA